jgi:oligosaccharide 4-alpha-D-glucosyltransferase
MSALLPLHRAKRLLRPFLPLLLLLGLLLSAEAREYRGHKLTADSLEITTDDGLFHLSFRSESALEVLFEPAGKPGVRSFVLDPKNHPVAGSLSETKDGLSYSAKGLRAVLVKTPFHLEFYRGEERLLSEAGGFYCGAAERGVRFQLAPDEKLLGGGERVLGMDRRGYRLSLYNAPAYGYSSYAERLNYSLPGLLSSRHYLLMFDNIAKGWMDLGHDDPDVLSFEAVGGRLSYLVVAGASFPEIVSNYTAVSGRQPMPARWTLGYIASRFGYRSEEEGRMIVSRFREAGLPLDAIIFDLYWFGKDLKGLMGALTWERGNFPNPEGMMADFRREGVNTVLITEPYILTSSTRWAEAVANKALATDGQGHPFTFDFYFGNTGIVDIFDPKARDWFWSIYRDLMKQGVAGWWGDVGEPETHPSGAVHALGTADEVHNGYGHEWAGMVAEGMRRDFPDARPFILMRSGFAGSQRYGILPWTGDVSRSWGGLKAQVELSLQMGLLGIAYTHSDLGGFAGRELDPELYVRWLQYGVFQPIYRPHGFEAVPSEPVLHEGRTRELAERAVKLRYQLMPYTYTLAHQNSTTGLPLMRPLFFCDETRPALMDDSSAYLWGDAFLVTPITTPGMSQLRVSPPKGVWFDFFNERRLVGGRQLTLPVDAENIPVLVKAGSFLPMLDQIRNAANYSSRQLTLHYYADASVSKAEGSMYEDDGGTAEAFEKGLFEILHFTAAQSKSGLSLSLNRELGSRKGYKGMPEHRTLRVVIHNYTPPAGVADAQLATLAQASGTASPVTAWYEPATHRLNLTFDWDHSPSTLQLR